MAYSTLPTVNPGDSLSSTDWGNVVKANIEYLFSGRQYDNVVSTVFAQTSSTSYVDVDATNLSITVTPAGARVLIIGYLILSSDGTASNTATVKVYCSSGESSAEIGLTTANSFGFFTTSHMFTSLTPGVAYTFRWQYKAGTGLIHVNLYRAGSSLLGIEA